MKRALTIFLILVVLAGCTAGTEPEQPAVEPESGSRPPQTAAVSEVEEEPEPEPPQIALSPLRDDPTDLDLQRMREDFDYLWLAMERGYPFLGVARRSGIDVDEVRRRYRDGLEEVEDHAAFAGHLGRMVAEFSFIGHFELLDRAATYQHYCDVYEVSSEGHSAVLARTLREGRTVAAYRHLAGLEGIDFDPNRELAWADYSPAQGGSGNLRTEILAEGEIAYLYIGSFSGQYQERDYDALLAFYREIAQYGHLVIDLTDNGGGSDGYWWQGIVMPNLKGPLTSSQLILFNGASPENRAYLAATAGKNDVYPLEALPELPALEEADKAALDSFLTQAFTVEPEGDTPLFGGDIWVLVGPAVYSSSEGFAIFCQSSGFATLVGESTGGDGGGWDPPFVALPHSGLLARYSVYYTLNPDGSNNEEFGTRPDIPCEPGETPLEACLRAIRDS